MDKRNYIVPETEILSFQLEKDFLVASGGPKSKGFTIQGQFEDNDWSIN